MDTLGIIVSKLRDIPILNTEAYRLIDYVSQPQPSFVELEGMIKNNPGLSSQIARMANSSFFKRSRQIETLNESLVSLGFATLKQIFTFNFYSSVGSILKSQKDVINHGVQCSKLAEFIARGAVSPSDECAKVSLAGLLHDIGQQFLAYFFPSQYEQVKNKIRFESKPTYAAEKLIFGTDHQVLGKLLCDRWNFPPYLGAIIADHHKLSDSVWNGLILPVFCANNFLNERDRVPFEPYLDKLKEYFAMKHREIPWKSIKDEFAACVRGSDSPLQSALAPR